MTKFRRQIFYLSGFDPRGPAFYHALCQSELAKYAALSGSTLPHVSPRTVDGHRADWRIETERCQTDYVFLRWDDLVRARWHKRKDRFLRDVVGTYLSYIFASRNREAMKLAPVVGRTFYFPLALVAAALLTTLVLILFLGWLGLLAFPVLVTSLFFLFHRWQPAWLLHIFNFNRELCGRTRVDLEERCDLYAHQIAASLSIGHYDEILLVGHSNGATLLLMVLDRLRTRFGGAMPLALKLLTLGQLTQFVTLHRDGVALRQTLRRLETITNSWLDISAKADPACFALVSPFAPDGPLPPNLTIASARLHLLYAPAIYRRLKRDQFNYHFLYLRCSDRLGAWNYPGLTISPQPLEHHIAAIRRDAHA